MPPLEVLLLTANDKGASFAVVLMTADAQLRMRVIEKASVTPPLQKGNSLNRKPLKITHKN